VAVCKGQTILPDDLPGEVSAEYVEPHELEKALPVMPHNGSNGTHGGDVREIDAARIRGALEACQWRRHRAAEVLGISRTTLWRRMRDLGLG
jgi:transcriptional regulator of acetoin/glycerol metabolism